MAVADVVDSAKEQMYAALRCCIKEDISTIQTLYLHKSNPWPPAYSGTTLILFQSSPTRKAEPEK